MAKSQLQKLIEAGMQFSEVSRKQTESLVKSLVKDGDVRRKDAEKLVQSLIERGRETSEAVAKAVEREVERQREILGARIESLEAEVDSLADQLVTIGITRIEGDIVGDGSRYDDEFRVPSWGEEITLTSVISVSALSTTRASVPLKR